MNAKLTMTILALATTGTMAMAQNLTLWRGETRTEILRDNTAVGVAPEGITVKVGTALPVRHLDRPQGTHYGEVADRVQWGSSAPGLKVVSVSVDEGVRPGEYSAGGLNIRVLDRVLPQPKDWKYYLDLWQHPWAVARYFGVEPFSPAHYAKMKPVWEQLASAGNKTLTVSLLELPWAHQCYDGYHSMVRRIKLANGKWKFDYRVFDAYVEFGRKCGLGRHIACYTMCPWSYVVRWEDEAGNVQSAKAVPGTPEFVDFWGDFIVDFAAHLKAKGWFDDTFIAMDERSPEDVMNICRFLQEKAPGLKASLAGNRAPSEFKGIEIQSYCSALGHLTDALVAEAAERRAKGEITTMYVCCGPRYPNTFCASEREESFWLGAYPAMVGIDGFLRWAWNSWPQEPTVDASYGEWLPGDTFLVYPDGSPSLRFLELRNGIVAAEKVRILKEKGLFAKELADLAAQYDRKAAMANKCNWQALRNRTLDVVNR